MSKLIILGGVQASGKTTIHKAIMDCDQTVVSLPRTDNLKAVLLDAPRDIGTSEHVNHLYRIFNEWDNMLQIMNSESDDTYLLDAGPITTIAYNLLTLHHALFGGDTAWDHYIKTRSMAYSPHRKYLDRDSVSDLYLECAEVCSSYLLNSYMATTLIPHDRVVTAYLNADPQVIIQRFNLRTSDVRQFNMQDWFKSKADEMATYESAYVYAQNVLESKFPTVVSEKLAHLHIETGFGIMESAKRILSRTV